jgi:hypothetical protein
MPRDCRGPRPTNTSTPLPACARASKPGRTPVRDRGARRHPGGRRRPGVGSWQSALGIGSLFFKARGRHRKQQTPGLQALGPGHSLDGREAALSRPSARLSRCVHTRHGGRTVERLNAHAHRGPHIAFGPGGISPARRSATPRPRVGPRGQGAAPRPPAVRQGEGWARRRRRTRARPRWARSSRSGVVSRAACRPSRAAPRSGRVAKQRCKAPDPRPPVAFDSTERFNALWNTACSTPCRRPQPVRRLAGRPRPRTLGAGDLHEDPHGRPAWRDLRRQHRRHRGASTRTSARG